MIRFVYGDTAQALEQILSLLDPSQKVISIYGLAGKHWAWIESKPVDSTKITITKKKKD